MPKYSISDAARRAKIARSTMYERFINTGKISTEEVTVNGNKRKVIDSSEWERVFGRQTADSTSETSDSVRAFGDNTSKTGTTDMLVQVLLEQLAKAEARELRLLDQVDRLTRQLEYKPVMVPDPVTVAPIATTVQDAVVAVAEPRTEMVSEPAFIAVHPPSLLALEQTAPDMEIKQSGLKPFSNDPDSTGLDTTPIVPKESPPQRMSLLQRLFKR
jgi:hypothetical protein